MNAVYSDPKHTLSNPGTNDTKGQAPKLKIQCFSFEWKSYVFFCNPIWISDKTWHETNQAVQMWNM